MRPILALCGALLAPALPACGGAELEEAKTALDEKEKELGEAKSQIEALSTKNAALSEEVSATEKAAEKLEGKIGSLEGEKGKLEGKLAETEAKVKSLKAIESALAKALVKEVEAGDITVSQRGGYLVVDVSDKVLFDTGKAEVKDKGKAILDKVAVSLKELPKDQIIQVGGHTDDQPIKSEEVKAKFPTNWELSTARATTVVRHLQEVAGIPGKRLVAAGFSQYRPVSKRKSKKGRKRNRRIEIALLPPRS